MDRELIVKGQEHQLTVSLNDGTISDKIIEALPFETRASKWGEEIYFAVPVDAEEDQPTNSVEVGDVAYWPEGSSLALFYGPTPMSEGDQPVPADDVEVIGTISSGLEEIDRIEAGESLELKNQS